MFVQFSNFSSVFFLVQDYALMKLLTNGCFRNELRIKCTMYRTGAKLQSGQLLEKRRNPVRWQLIFQTTSTLILIEPPLLKLVSEYFQTQKVDFSNLKN